MKAARVFDFNEKSAEKLAKEYAEYKRIEKDAKKALEELQAQLVTILGDAEEMTAGLFTIRNKHFERKQFDSKRFQTDNPDMYEQYCNTVDRTRFSVGV